LVWRGQLPRKFRHCYNEFKPVRYILVVAPVTFFYVPHRIQSVIIS
jgi:hypothetical protein